MAKEKRDIDDIIGQLLNDTISEADLIWLNQRMAEDESLKQEVYELQELNQLEKLLEGRLSPEAEIEVQKSLNLDPRLNQKYKKLQAAKLLIRADQQNQLLEKVNYRGSNEIDFSENGKKKIKTSFEVRRWRVSGGLILIIMIGLVIWINSIRKNNNKFIDDTYKNEDVIEVIDNEAGNNEAGNNETGNNETGNNETGNNEGDEELLNQKIDSIRNIFYPFFRSYFLQNYDISKIKTRAGNNNWETHFKLKDYTSTQEALEKFFSIEENVDSNFAIQSYYLGLLYLYQPNTYNINQLNIEKSLRYLSVSNWILNRSIRAKKRSKIFDSEAHLIIARSLENKDSNKKKIRELLKKNPRIIEYLFVNQIQLNLLYFQYPPF